MKLNDQKKHFLLFYMIGFLIGILYANVISKDYISMTGIFNEYFLNQYAQTELIVQEYIWYLVKVRVTPLIMIGVTGCLRIRKGVVICFILWTGFLSGILFTSAVMKMGIKGIILCLIALLPQFLLYIVGYVVLLWYLYRYPDSRWNLSKTVFLVLAVGIGILLECYVNPIIVKMFLKTI